MFLYDSHNSDIPAWEEKKERKKERKERKKRKKYMYTFSVLGIV